MILVMFSGGLDSTGVLYKFLKETNEPIHVHHIDIQNLENRWIPERYAVSRVLAYCKTIRDFRFTSSCYEFLQFRKHFTWDNDIVRFVAAQIAKGDPQIKQVALGKCADDDVNPAFRIRAIQANAIWHACFTENAGSVPEIIRPVENMTKRQIWEMLPPSLQQQIWSCRTPVFHQRIYSYCLSCNTCQAMIKQGIIKDPRQAGSNPAPTEN